MGTHEPWVDPHPAGGVLGRDLLFPLLSWSFPSLIYTTIVDYVAWTHPRSMRGESFGHFYIIINYFQLVLREGIGVIK